jgi:hypothetical protein
MQLLGWGCNNQVDGVYLKGLHANISSLSTGGSPDQALSGRSGVGQAGFNVGLRWIARTRVPQAFDVHVTRCVSLPKFPSYPVNRPPTFHLHAVQFVVGSIGSYQCSYFSLRFDVFVISAAVSPTSSAAAAQLLISTHKALRTRDQLSDGIRPNQ